MKKTVLISIAVMTSLAVSAQTEITTNQAKAMYRTLNMRYVSVHDPSVVYEPDSKQYYIFGSHRAQARTSSFQSWNSFLAPWGTVTASGNVVEASNQQAFLVPQVKKVNVNGVETDLPAFNAHEWSAAYGDYSVNGNMWAPDVIYNKVLKKWCMYLSINGPTWNSSIILLTSDRIDGTYVYQAPVVVTGFINSTNAKISYKLTDLELAIGKQNSLPSRYNIGNQWGTTWPHAIDPCVFYDEEGQLWMSYGSWSGGIWMLKLDNNTGLRDYNVQYSSDYNTMKAGVTSDPYFGKKVAGGYYVSGEGSYIEHIGNYYYLFVTNGGLDANGGYEMRVFRSKNPDGPYLDTRGVNAIYTRYVLNYGINADTRGEKIIGSYGGWGFMTLGETAQGHNSIIAADDGRTYLVYHTRFHDGGGGHQIRTHQVFVNEDGWLVAAPFQYTGETFTDDSVATRQAFADNELPGTYQLIIHKYSMDHKNLEEVTPVKIQLLPDGTVTGAYTGTWTTKPGTSYLSLKLGGIIYKGVAVEQHMEPTTVKAVAFSGCSSSGVNAWAYKMRDDYALAYSLNNSTIPSLNNRAVNMNLKLNTFNLQDNVTLEWTSSAPDIINEHGQYNPAGLENDSVVTLTARLTCGNYYWTQTYNVRAKAESTPSGDFSSNMIAYYCFDETPLVNAFNESERATFAALAKGKKPVLESDFERNGKFVHVAEETNANCSYVRFTNPLYGLPLENGVTFAFWLKRNTDDTVNDILGFFNNSADGTQRFFFTGNNYFGYSDGPGNVMDLKGVQLPVGEWCHVIFTISAADGIRMYMDKVSKSTFNYSGTLNGMTISTKSNCDFSLFIDCLRDSRNFHFGYGTKWGSADVCIDDFMIFDRVLTASDVTALYTMANRVYDFSTTGISPLIARPAESSAVRGIFNLQGQRVAHPQKGIYIIDGKKTVIR